MAPKERVPSPSEAPARTNLELFVLAAVRAGLDSAYDLNKFADLSVGTTLPLLSRLEAGGLLRSRAAARRSKQYSITAYGQSVVQRSWRALLTVVPREFEAILRLAYVAAILDRRLDTTRKFLKAAAADRERFAKEREGDRKLIEREAGRVVFGRGHRWLRAHSDAVRLQAEARLLSRLAAREDLTELLIRVPQ